MKYPFACYHYCYVCSAILALFCTAVCSGFTVDRCETSTHKGSLLHAELEVMTLDFRFTEDLYVVQSLHDCPPHTCPNTTSAFDCACDYAVNCGTALPGSEDDSCECSEISCSGTWNVLTADSPVEHTVTLGEVKHFRFVVSNPCAVMEVTMEALYGWPQFTISKENGEERVNLHKQHFSNKHYLCPGANLLQRGTWFVAVSAADGEPAKFRLTLTNAGEPPREDEYDDCPPVTLLNRNNLYPGCRRTLSRVAGTTRLMKYTFPKEHVGCPTYFSLYAYDGSNPIHVWMSYKHEADFGPYDSSVAWTSPPWSPEDAWVLYDDYRAALSFCPEESEAANLTMYIAVWAQLDTTSITLMANSDPLLFHTVSVASLDPYSGMSALVGSSQLLCPDMNHSCFHSYNFQGEEGRAGSCDLWSIRMPYSSAVVWPLPPLVWKEHPGSRLAQLEPTSSLEKYSYVGMVTLDYTQPPALRRFKAATLTKESIKSCLVSFAPGGLSRLTDQKGIPVERQTFPLSSCLEPEPRCDSSNFYRLMRKAEDIMKSMETSTNPGEMKGLQLALEALAFSSEWKGCKHLVEMMLDRQEETVTATERCRVVNMVERMDYHLAASDPDNVAIVTLQQIIAEDLEDPCCSEPKSWTHCCVETEIGRPHLTFTEVIQEEVTSRCEKPECSREWLKDYAELTNLDEGCDSILGSFTEESAYTVAAFDFWRHCTEAVFGHRFRGFECSSDEDCPHVATCGIRGRCLNTEKDAQEAFLQCFVDNADPFLLSQLRKKYSLDKAPTADTLLSLYQEHDCLPTNGLVSSSSEEPLTLRNHWHFGKVNSRCFDDCREDFHCLSRRCTIPLECNYDQSYASEKCTRHWRYIAASESECTSSGVCNWDPTITTETECLSGPQGYCAVCEGDECIAVKEAEHEGACNNIPYCVLLGKIKPNISPEECFLCTGKCFTANGKERECSAEECSTSGRCLDDKLFLDEPKGVCINTELYPYFSQTCADTIPVGLQFSDDLTFRLTYYGCVLEGLFDEITPALCAKYAEYGYVYTYRPKNSSEDCLSLGSSCEQTSNAYFLFNRGDPIGSSLKILTPKDEEQCTCDNGTITPWFEWTEGRLHNGKIMNATWLQKEWQPSHQWVQNFDYSRLEKDVEEAAHVLYGKLQLTDARCRFNSVMYAMNAVACDCGEHAEAECAFPSKIPKVPQRPVCAGFAQTIVSHPHQIQVSDTSLPADGECVDLTTTDYKAFHLRKVTNRRLLGLFTYFERTVREWGSVVNLNGAVVGQLRGHGLTITWDGPISNFTLCMELSQAIDVYDDYQIPDFAVLNSSGLIPLGLSSVFLAGNHLCGVIGNTEGAATTRTYFPVMHEDDWEDTDDWDLSNGEVAVFSVITVVYSLLACLALGELVWVCIVHRLKWTFIHWLGPITLVFALFRALYFLLLVTGILSNDIIEYMLLEFPNVLFFSALTIILTILGEILLRSSLNARISPRAFRAGWFLMTVAYILLFTLLVILYELLPEDVGSDCAGVLDSESSTDYSNHDVVNIVYLSCKSMLAFVTACLFLFFGGRIYFKLILLKKKSHRKGEKQGSKVFIISLAACVCFTIQSVVLLALTVSSWKDAAWFGALMLMATEVSPLSVIIIVLLIPRQVQHPSHKSSSSTSSGQGTTATATNVSKLQSSPSSSTSTASSVDYSY